MHNKALFLIALIACATAGNSFLGSLRKNYEKAKAEFDDQFAKQQKLQQKAEGLQQDLSAAKAIDPEAVVDTVNGLTEAAKFWGSFVGNEIFNKEDLSEKISDLKDKREQLAKYASEDGTAAMVALNQAIWDITVCIKSIQSLAIQLKKGAKNVMLITAIAFKKDQDMLEGKEKVIYEAAIRVLVNTLKSGNTNAAVIQEKLYTLSGQLITIETQMSAVSKRLRDTAAGKSEEFKAWRSDMRAKVYGGCAASILLGPMVVICYGTAAAVLETEIADYKRETELFVSEFTSWSETFGTLSTMANQAQTVSKAWYGKITDFKNVIQSQYDLISATQEDLWISHDMRQLISDQLVELITACDVVINDTTGKLEGADEQMLNAEFPEPAAADEVTEAEVNDQIIKTCHNAHSDNLEKQKRCIEQTMKSMSSTAAF